MINTVKLFFERQTARNGFLFQKVGMVRANITDHNVPLKNTLWEKGKY